MAKSRNKPSSSFSRLDRPLTLGAQVEQVLRQAILSGEFVDDRLPTEVELADQLGVSRETVRLAAEVLQREGLLVKIRRKGTFVNRQNTPMELPKRQAKLLGYLQANYQETERGEASVVRTVSGMMLQGALEEAGKQGYRLMVQEAAPSQLLKTFQQMYQGTQLAGVLFVSCAEEKVIKRLAGLGLPTVLVDHDLHVPQINSVRDDSFEGAREAIRYLAGQGHRHIVFAAWHQIDLNPWRLAGYRQGLRDQNLPRRRQWEIATELNEAGAKTFVEAWLKLSPRPSAIYCFNNTLANLIVAELRRAGTKVPDEVSVFGGGGENFPGLTCHQADWYQLGRQGVQILLRALKAGDAHQPEHNLVPHKIRDGETVRKIASE